MQGGASGSGAPPASGTLLSLGPRDLHLWLARGPGLPSSREFLFDVLSRYLPRPADGWRLASGRWGKPALAAPGAGTGPQPLAFNLSDSAGWRACALSAGPPVGVDLERCQPTWDVMRVARRFFHPGEIAALEACAPRGRCALFHAMWTLKEARVKALGEALPPALPEAGFALHPSNGTGPWLIDALPPVTTGPAHYHLHALPGALRLATCLLQPAAPELTLWEWLPGGAGRVIPHRLLARSPPLPGTGVAGSAGCTASR